MKSRKQFSTSRTHRWAYTMSFLAVLCMLVSTSATLAFRPPPERPVSARQGIKKIGRGVVPTILRSERAKLIGNSQATAKTAKRTDASKTNKARPTIKCEESVHDFGNIWVGPVLHHTFKISNTGTMPLEITRVKPSCGCTIAGNYPKVIQPGETGDFPFSVNSKKLRNKFEKGITITSTDPITPTMRLRLRGQVKQYVDVSPPNVYFGKITGDDRVERIVTITNNTDQPLEVTMGSPVGGGVETELITKEKGKSYELRVAYVPPFKNGVFRRTINLNTNIVAQKTMTIEVRGSVPERLEVNPAVISLGAVRANNTKSERPTTRLIRFTNYGNRPVKLLEAISSDPKIKVQINEQRAGKAYNIQVQIPAGYVVPASGTMITLKTDDKKTPTIEVPVKSLAARNAANKSKKPRRRRPAEEMVGQMAPAFTLNTIDGKPVGGNSLKGKVTVLDFFANNCGFCSKQIPRVEAIRKQFESKGVRFIAMSQTMRGKKYTKDQTIDKMNKLGFKGELCYDPDNVSGPLFKATSYPTMVIIGKTGKVEAVNVGNIGDLESRMKTQLTALLAGKPIPTITKAVVNNKNKPKSPSRGRPTDLVGKQAPTFSFKTLDGKTIDNNSLKNYDATIINVVASNCGYCKKQVPRLEKIRQKYEGKKVQFVNLVQTMRKEYKTDEVVSIFKKAGSNLDISHDVKNQIGPLFNARGFPTMIVLGKSGKIEAVNVGNIADLEKKVPAQIDALIAGKPLPKVVTTPSKPRRRPAEAMAGKTAPTFALTTHAGKAVGSNDFKNHTATILNFVAPNCGFCKRQLPNIEKIRAEYEAKGVRFVNLHQTMRKEYSKEEAAKIFKGTGANLEIATDSGNFVGKQYKATSFPTMFVIDKKGRVAHVNIGAKANLDTLLKGQLDALIKNAGK